MLLTIKEARRAVKCLTCEEAQEESSMENICRHHQGKMKEEEEMYPERDER